MDPTGILQLFTVQSFLSYAALYRKLLKTFVAMVASCIEIMQSNEGKESSRSALFFWQCAYFKSFTTLYHIFT